MASVRAHKAISRSKSPGLVLLCFGVILSDIAPNVIRILLGLSLCEYSPLLLIPLFLIVWPVAEPQVLPKTFSTPSSQSPFPALTAPPQAAFALTSAHPDGAYPQLTDFKTFID
jgi:hypothetical protein